MNVKTDGKFKQRCVNKLLWIQVNKDGNSVKLFAMIGRYQTIKWMSSNARSLDS